MGRLIIELIPAPGHGTHNRYVFNSGEVTVGRSYSNDIILSDPFVSPEHLSISLNGNGFYITDLASENGTKINQDFSLKDQVAMISSGDEICIGNTRFKIILPDHPVEPARRLGRLAVLNQFFERTFVAIGLSLLAAVLTAWTVHIETPSDKFWNEASLASLMEYLRTAVFYTGFFGLISYVRLHKTYFRRHLAVFNVFISIASVYSLGGPFLMFWLSHPGIIILAKYIPVFIFLAGMFWASMKLTQDWVKRADQTVLTTIAFLYVLILVLQSGDIQFKFSNKPHYSGVLAPYLEPLTEPESYEAFLQQSGRELFETPEK